MIIIAGAVTGDPARREAALDAGRRLMEETRQLKGCRDYVWSADPAVSNRIYVYERWDSEPDLAAHLAGPLYIAMRDTIAAHGLRGADVAKFEIGRSGAVYDSKGRPRADFFEGDAEA